MDGGTALDKRLLERGAGGWPNREAKERRRGRVKAAPR